MEADIKTKIDEFSTKFDSEEIKDADSVESSSFQFRNWFVTLDYKIIQPHFDDFFNISLKIASHYRPPVQANGCDCLYIIATQGAPAQIKRVGSEIKKCTDKLVQVGHNEVMPSLMPLLSKCVPMTYENPSSDEFHEFFLHFLETWSRESITPVSSYSFSKTAIDLMEFIGLSISRYIKPILSIIMKRLAFNKSLAHTRRYAKVILEMSKQSFPVISTNIEEIRKIIGK